MRRSRKNNTQRYRKSHRNKRRRHKTIKKFVGGQEEEKKEENKTFVGVITGKVADVVRAGTDVGLGIVGLKRAEEPPPPPPPPPEEKEKEASSNEAVMSVSNAANNIADAANSVVAETLNLTDKLNDPETVERLEEGLDNIGKIASPVVDNITDKAVEVFEKQSPKVVAAGMDMIFAAANAVPGVGAVLSLGREVDDVQKIIAAGTESTKEILETVNESVVEGVQQYEQIKNSVKPTMPDAALAVAKSLPTTSTSASAILKGGGGNLRRLQSAGATINNRINDSINEFMKNKTLKKKRVRFDNTVIKF
jgi:hypothetical protein